MSLIQTATRAGKRSSTYRAFLEGDTERRPNLTIITGAHVTRIVLEGSPGRVADASVMPNVVAGNTNAAAIMIGEKTAEMLAADHGVKLGEFVGESPARRVR